MIDVVSFEKWKQRVMRETDRAEGNKLALRFEFVKARDGAEKVHRKLKGINEKFLEYAIVYRSHGLMEHTEDVAITFDKIKLLPVAIWKHRNLLWETAPLHVIPIWVGGYRLFVLVEINQRTEPVLRQLQKKARIPRNYDGPVLG